MTTDTNSGFTIAAQPRVAALVRLGGPKAGRLDKVRLDINENVVGFSNRVVEEMLATVTPSFLSSYPEPGPLYEAIARLHDVDTKQVMVSGGSELAIRYVFETYLGPDSELVVLEPSFAMFAVYAQLLGARVIRVACSRQLTFSADDILESMSSRTRIVAIANPNNPTGTVLSEPELLSIIERAASLGALVLVDEAYFYFYRGTMIPHVLQKENLVVTRTFSKACGLASLRVGYAVGPKTIIAEVQKLQPIDHTNGLAVLCGAYILDHLDLVWEYADQVEAGKRYLLEALAELGLPAIGGHGNFVVMDFGSERERVVSALRQDGILLGTWLRLPFENNYVRATVGPVAQMEVLVTALARHLAQAGSPRPATGAV
jgi:histidinol-phosphate aminotransferase